MRDADAAVHAHFVVPGVGEGAVFGETKRLSFVAQPHHPSRQVPRQGVPKEVLGGVRHRPRAATGHGVFEAPKLPRTDGGQILLERVVARLRHLVRGLVLGARGARDPRKRTDDGAFLLQDHTELLIRVHLHDMLAESKRELSVGVETKVRSAPVIELIQREAPRMGDVFQVFGGFSSERNETRRRGDVRQVQRRRVALMLRPEVR